MVCPDECYTAGAATCSQGTRALDEMACSSANMLFFKAYFPISATFYLIFAVYASFQVRVIILYQKEALKRVVWNVQMIGSCITASFGIVSFFYNIIAVAAVFSPAETTSGGQSYSFAVNFFIGCSIVLLSTLLLHLLLFWSTLTTGRGGGQQEWLTTGTRRLFFSAIAGLTVLEMTYRIYRSFRTVPTALFLAYTGYIVPLTCTISGISLYFALRLRKQTKAGRQARRRAVVADLSEEEAARVAKKLKAVGDYTTMATRLIIQINIIAIVVLVTTAIYSVGIGVFGYKPAYHLVYFVVTDVCQITAGLFGSFLLRPPPRNVRKRRMSIGDSLSVSHSSAQSASERRASIVRASNTSVEMVPLSGAGASASGGADAGASGNASPTPRAPAAASLAAEEEGDTARRKRGMSKVRFADGEDASSGAGDGLATEGPQPIVVEEDAIELEFAAAEMSSEDEHMIALGIRTSSASERLSTASRASLA